MIRFHTRAEDAPVLCRTTPGPRVWLVWLGLFWALTLAMGCAGPQLSPITQAPTNTIHAGKIVWHDLLTPDVAAAQRFYAGVFGWSFQDLDGYSLARLGDMPVAGIAAAPAKAAEQKAGRWLVYLSVTDVDKAAAAVVSAGGKILKGPGDMRGRGRYVMVTDPQGAPLVLLRAAKGDPPDGPPLLNGWLWNELWSSDPTASQTFYTGLAGLDAARLPDDPQGKYWVLGSKSAWRAGITGLPFEDARSRWVPCIRVGDLGKVLAKVEQLGGRALLRPDHPLSNGSVAVVADPWGAVFMVEKWEPKAGGKEPSQ